METRNFILCSTNEHDSDPVPIRNQNQTQTLTLTQLHPTNMLAIAFLAICLNVSLFVLYGFLYSLLSFMFSFQFELLDSSTLIIFSILYKLQNSVSRYYVNNIYVCLKMSSCILMTHSINFRLESLYYNNSFLTYIDCTEETCDC